MGGPQALTLAQHLAARAAECPRRDLLRMPGRTITFAEFDREVNRLANGLLAAGVQRGEMVGVMLPNSPEFALLWLALLRIGAVEAPVNTAFRGAGLAHLLDLCRCRLLVIDDSFLPVLEEIRSGLGHLERVITRAELAELRGPDRDPGLAVEVEERAQIFFTSGTTGRSKACLFDHRYAVREAELFLEGWRVRPDDVLYNCFPLFHIDASVLTLAPAIVGGCTAALTERFSASRFWDEIREFEATIFDFMGATLTILWKQPQRPDDTDNPVRMAWGIPMPDFADTFEERFQLRLVERFGMTDCGTPVMQPYDEPRRRGSCGKVVPPYEIDIAEDGELLVRCSEPGLMTLGYYGMPEVTAEAFRNGWFHTGDLARLDGEGWLYYLGRKKDMIRRRGENISAFEVEEVVQGHPAVLQAAAFGVPSELTEEEVKVCVVLRPGASLAHAELARWCEGRMAKHMVPRYIEFLDDLPLTPTEKVEKYRLREAGLTAGTWDRELT
ncbi:MAG TPA: AMP-binding protein [Candidatus Dormibacteraeota bacterium]